MNPGIGVFRGIVNSLVLAGLFWAAVIVWWLR